MKGKLEGKLLLVLLTWAVIIAFFVVARSANFINDAEIFLIQALGIVDVAAIIWIIPVLLWLLPVIVIQYCLGDFISRQLNHHAVYLFTRTSKRGSWLIGQFYMMIKYILFFQLVEVVVVILTGIALGAHIEDKISFLIVAVQIYVLAALGLIVFALLVNVLSLVLNSVVSLVLMFLANVLCIMSAAYLYDKLPLHSTIARLIPFTQNVYGWQYSIYRSTDEIDISNPSCYIMALAYLIIGGSLVLFSGLLVIKNKDIY